MSLPGSAARLSVEQISGVCYEANREYSIAIGELPPTAPHWAEAPEFMRDSTMAGVNAFIRKPEMTPEDLHQHWCVGKLNDGWKYGPVKNAETKEHPCLVAYHDLPHSQRVKDFLFRAIISSLLPPILPYPIIGGNVF